MNTVALCGVILLAAVVALVIREYSKTAASLVAVAVAVGTFAYIIYRASGVYDSLSELTANEAVAPYVNTLLKGLGIAYLTSFTAATCRDMGSDSAAKLSELIGKTELVILAVPLTLELAGLAGELLT